MKTTIISRFYYSIWSDVINRMQERFPDSKFYWKFMTMLGVSFPLGLNSLILYGLIGSYFKAPLPKLNLFQNNFWEITLSALIFFFMPWILLNYYFVFWKNKYLVFLPKYKNRNGKMFFNFLVYSVFSPLALLVIAVIIAKMVAA